MYAGRRNAQGEITVKNPADNASNAIDKFNLSQLF
jgi:hypothetical protein